MTDLTLTLIASGIMLVIAIRVSDFFTQRRSRKNDDKILTSPAEPERSESIFKDWVDLGQKRKVGETKVEYQSEDALGIKTKSTQIPDYECINVDGTEMTTIEILTALRKEEQKRQEFIRTFRAQRPLNTDKTKRTPIGVYNGELMVRNRNRTISPMNAKDNIRILDTQHAHLTQKSTVQNIYPHLQGIDFGKIQRSPEGANPQEVFCSDPDGFWYFAAHHMSMIFRAVSRHRIEDELHQLLQANNIIQSDFEVGDGFVSWKGDGFQIEHAVIHGTDVLFVTNEAVATENALELQGTTAAPKVTLPTGYRNIGIESVYDGQTYLEANNGSLSHNIPLFFSDSEGHFILIGASTLPAAKAIIDNIISKNPDPSSFAKLQSPAPSWEYFHTNKFMTIGFLPRQQCIRLNFLHQFHSVKP